MALIPFLSIPVKSSIIFGTHQGRELNKEDKMKKDRSAEQAGWRKRNAGWYGAAALALLGWAAAGPAGAGVLLEEAVLSATSQDGRTFTQDAGSRLTGGYVDPYVLRAQAGDWLMLVSTTPSTDRLPQKIYLASSGDGVSWQVDTNVLIEVQGGNALDATAVALGNGSYRIYYIGTRTADPFSQFYLASGILSTGANGKWGFAPDGVDFGIGGVSPEALAMGSNAVRLYITADTGGMKLYSSADGLAFTEEPAAALPSGSDPTIVELADQRLRMYYIEMDAEGNKEIFSATSLNGLQWTVEGSVGIVCGSVGGVPDSFIDPASKIRLFWVGMVTSSVPTSLASPAPVFSAYSAGVLVGRIQVGAKGAAVSFLGLGDAAWAGYQLIAATVHCPLESKGAAAAALATVVMDSATLVPYLVSADENNNYLGHTALLGVADPAVWAAYAVDAAGDIDGDGFAEYVVRERAGGSTFLAFTEGAANQLRSIGSLLGIDPAALAGYRVEAAGDADRDGYADLAVRELATGCLYLVHNNGAGGYDNIEPLFGLAAGVWSQYHLESIGEFNGDGLLDYVIQDAGRTVTYKVFGTGRNSYAGLEAIP